MKSARLEPGILAIFRLFLVVQFVLMLVNLLVHHARGYLEGRPETALAIVGGCLLALFGYLSWSWLARKLGRFYLPLGLVLSTVFSLAAQNLFLTVPISAGSGGSEVSTWQLFLFLSVPLVLTGWQYGLRSVVAYCLFVTVLDLLLILLTYPDYGALHQTYNRLLFIRLLSFLLVGYVISRIMQQLRRERRALQEANAQLECYVGTLEQLTVSRERNRVARELHDTLAHTLSGLAVQLEAVNSLWSSDRKQARQILAHSLTATRDGLTETRRAIQSLRAAPLEDLGLCRALRDCAEAAAGRAGFRLELDMPPALEGLPVEVEQCFYRVGQEAVENAGRHAEAKSVRVRLVQAGPELRLEVSDDGIGFDPQVAGPGSRFGLQGMRERAGVIHARLEIESQPSQGTRVQLVWKSGGTA